MNITVVGAGNGGTTMAADLSKKGHRVSLLKTSVKMYNEYFKHLLDQDGRIVVQDIDDEYTTKIHRVTSSYEEAFADNPEIVVLFVQTNYHESVIKKLSPHLKDGQIILIEPGYLSTSYVKKYCGNIDLTVAEAESSPIDCRIIEPGRVKVLFKNVRNPIGIYPAKHKERAEASLKQLGYNFVILDSVVEAALHNPNLIVHTVGAIMSIPRIEYSKGDYWMYREVFTPSVWKLVEKLDQEKMQILKTLNLDPTPYVEACKYRNSEDLNVDAKEVFFDYAQHHSPPGPREVDSRYVTEDVPEGLVLVESLGKMLKVETPVTTALIDIANGCLDIDFRKTGRTIERLGYDVLQEILR